MSRLKNRRFEGLIVTAVCGLALLVACSTDSPTAPLQVPPPPTDGGSDAWNITLSASPPVLIAGADQPATITVQVRDKITGFNPPPGSTIGLTTNIGEFDFAGSEALSTAAVIDLGNASALLFPSSFAATATVTAEYDGSRGSISVQIGTEDAFITKVSPNSGPEAGGTSVTISGVGLFGPLRVKFGNDFGTVSSSATDGTSVRVKTPPYFGTFLTEECTKSGVTGQRNIPTPVTVSVETASDSDADLPRGYFYEPSNKSCQTN
jgi:hypothetical protein